MKVSLISSNIPAKTFSPDFRGSFSQTKIRNRYLHKGIVSDNLIHESAFFRDLAIIEFVNKLIYLKSLTLKDKTQPMINMVFGGCSEGFELLSSKMLASEAGIKANWLGFDLSENAIAKANSGIYDIIKPPELYLNKDAAGFSDQYLAFKDFEKMTPEQKRLKQIFDKYFTIEKADSGFDCDYMSAFFSQDAQIAKAHVREDFLDDVIFLTGNILDLDKIVAPNSADALFFKNALYHMTSPHNRILHINQIQETVSDVTTQIAKVLKPNGLFVLGALRQDHIGKTGDIIRETLSGNGLRPIFNNVVWEKVL